MDCRSDNLFSALPFPDAKAEQYTPDKTPPPDVNDVMPSVDGVGVRIDRAKKYLGALLNSKDPVTGELINIPLLSREDVAQTLCDTLALLDELASARKDSSPAVYYEKRDFTPEVIDKAGVDISDKPVRISGFITRINKKITDRGVRNLGVAQVMRWLCTEGYVREERINVVRSEKAFFTTDASAGVGILSLDSVDARTGEVKSSLLLSKDAQQLILDRLDDIIACEK